MVVRARVLAPAIAILFVALSLYAQPRSEIVHQRRLDVDAPWGRVPVWVGFPRRPDHREHPPGRRYPLLIALHGRGESVSLARGFLGWPVLYELPAAFAALQRGNVTRADCRGFARPEHLAQLNASLRHRPFGGIMVVSPSIPDVMGSDAARLPVLVEWLSGPLLAAVREAFPAAAQGPAATGIDGVSMGGLVSLEAGFRHPEAFGSVGAMQPAIRGREAEMAELAVAAAHQRAQHVQLLSSDGDPFLEPTRHLSELLRAQQVTHTLVVVPGPHDYVFNRGPAGIEMLFFHERSLESEPYTEPPH